MREYKISDKYSLADIGLEVSGSSLGELFRAAAEGMMAIIMGKSAGGASQMVHEMEIQAEDREQLMVDWLSEILYQFDAKGWVPIDFDLSLSLERPFRLKAAVPCRKFDPEIDQAEHEIKAVTYHRLEIKIANGTYRCHLVFDL